MSPESIHRWCQVPKYDSASLYQHQVIRSAWCHTWTWAATLAADPIHCEQPHKGGECMGTEVLREEDDINTEISLCGVSVHELTQLQMPPSHWLPQLLGSGTNRSFPFKKWSKQTQCCPFQAMWMPICLLLSQRGQTEHVVETTMFASPLCAD
ncbi:hypothetical protein JB92DRAFT_2828601 [Gautieria morchelliformis]|nr:hypothetical protein JB92DRAFT_2828601 [Gautieria morchelliformis]